MTARPVPATSAGVPVDLRSGWRLAVHVAVIVGLAGCAQPRPSPPPSSQAPMVIRAPSIQPGCLLPAPDSIDASTAGSIELTVEVSEAGSPTAVTVARSSGRAERDAAFQRAAAACAFTPALAHLPATNERKPWAGRHVLVYAWPAGARFVGPARCFQPAYPDAARRADEVAEVLVTFRRATPDAAFEFRVTSTPPSATLARASLAAAERCLAHPQAQTELQPGRWYSVPFSWRLE